MPLAHTSVNAKDCGSPWSLCCWRRLCRPVRIADTLYVKTSRPTNNSTKDNHMLILVGRRRKNDSSLTTSSSMGVQRPRDGRKAPKKTLKNAQETLFIALWEFSVFMGQLGIKSVYISKHLRPYIVLSGERGSVFQKGRGAICASFFMPKKNNPKSNFISNYGNCAD